VISREIHLDFHNAPHLTEIGAGFDPAQFAHTLRDSNVTSVNVFAKCHHGYSYYPTSVGEMHPGLGFDLLGAQIDALHAVGIQAPIYISVLWDDLMGERHPDWVITTREGRSLIRRPLSSDSPNEGSTGWTTLDLASGYGDYLCAMVEEILARYPVDGFWFDIVWAQPNYSPAGQRRMREAGVRMDDLGAVTDFAETHLTRFVSTLTAKISAQRPEATVFFNGLVTPTLGEHVSHMTQVEVESLPTSGKQWGYPHFPHMSRFVRTLGKPVIGMTGRFHKSWADFGGLKSKDQLAYECGTILSAGASISIGDQLDPRGELDAAVYRTIAHVYDYVQSLEPWLEDSVPMAELAVLGPTIEVMRGERPMTAHSAAVEGAAQTLLELGIQFDIIDTHSRRMSEYRAIMIPDGTVLDDDTVRLIEAAVACGVRVIAEGTAGLDPTRREFVLPQMPVRYVGEAPTVPTFLRLAPELARGELADDYPYAFYGQASVVEPTADAHTRGHLVSALFNRNWEHFTSHAHAPAGDDLAAPLVVWNGDVLYFSAPLVAAYRDHNYWVYREIFATALTRFLPRRLVTSNGPGWIEVTRHRQPRADDRPSRDLLHIVTYQSRRVDNGRTPYVDQAADVSGIILTLADPPGSAAVAYIAPSLEPIVTRSDEGGVLLELPPIGRHTLVVVEWSDSPPAE
jgi:hypothetical protein